MAKMSTKALLKRDAKRNIGDELVQAVGEMKAGKAGNMHRVAMSAVTAARNRLGVPPEHRRTGKLENLLTRLRRTRPKQRAWI